MSQDAKSRFVHVTYIRTTPERLWAALLEPEFTKAYWFGCWQQAEWKTGGAWKLMLPDGRLGDSGEVLEIEKERRLVLKWQNQFMPELNAEGFSRCTIELESDGELVKLSILHEMDKHSSKVIDAVSGGWPKILSSLKSLLETGTPLPSTGKLPEKSAA